MRPTKKAQGEPKFPPLAALLRPKTLNDIIGQLHLIGEGKPFRRMVERQKIVNTILWGPPGTGKTTLAFALAKEINANFKSINATETSVKEIREVIDNARQEESQTILFVDEIHRLNKSIKDIFLPVIEEGVLTLFGATTENPKFAVNSTILSRSLVFETKALNEQDLINLIQRVKEYYKRKEINIKINKEAAKKLIIRCSGDARKMITAMEAAIDILATDYTVTEEIIDIVFPSKHVVFDKDGNSHFDSAHCYQDAIQDSDADGAIYWLAAWLNSGEDPAYICRRMLISAFEDCSGNPFAITSALAATLATERTGMPECMIAMAHATIEMAKSKRNKSAFYAIHSAMADVQNNRTVYILPHMRAGNNSYERIINKKYVKDFVSDYDVFNDV